MSRRTKSWMVATIMTMLVTMLSFMGNSSTASAAGGDPIIPLTPSCTVALVSGDAATAPPAPTCYDPSGSDQDEFLVPDFYDSNGNHVGYENGAWSPYKSDKPNTTNGASQVFVQSTYYDSGVGMYVNGHAWTLSYNTSLTATPPPDTYWVVIGPCVSDNLREASLFGRNVPSADSRYIGSVHASATGSNGGITMAGTLPVPRVYDGTTVEIPLKLTEYYDPGLTAGETFVIKVWNSDKGAANDPDNPDRRLVKQMSVPIPACDDGPTQPSVRPTATVSVLHRGRVYNQVKVVLGSKHATRATYKVTRDPRRGRTIRRTYTTTYKVLRYDRVRKGTVITVRFGSTVMRRRI